MKLDFLRPFKAQNTAEFTLQAAGDNTTIVTWAMFGRKKADPAAGQKTDQKPTVTVVVPGR